MKDRFPCDDVHRPKKVLRRDDILVRSKQDVDRAMLMLEKIAPQYYGLTMDEFYDKICVNNKNNPKNHDPMFGDVKKDKHEKNL